MRLFSRITITLALFISGCNFSQPIATPTIVGDVVPQPDATATTSISTETVATASPSPTVIFYIQPATETPIPTMGEPTESPTPTPTPGPIQHTIAENETLIQIVQLYGYDNFAVIDQIVRMNLNIPDANTLPGPGTVILIPQPTHTPTPDGFELTSTASAGTPATPEPQRQVMQHVVKEGETVIGIAGTYNTTLRVIDQLNPPLRFFNCNLDIPSGGPDCNVPLSVGDSVNVPQPTPTPTLSPTPSGDETATFTPTFGAPLMVFPPQSANAPPQSINLQWVSIGILGDNEVYIVEVEDLTTGTVTIDATRETSFRLPSDRVPSDGQVHDMRWRIRIGILASDGAIIPVSAEPEWRSFQWRSR